MTAKVNRSAPLEELASAFKEAAREHGRATEAGDHRKTRMLYKQIAALSKEIKARGEEGAGALVELLGDENVSVRLWAAGDVLFIEPSRAEAELERIAKGPPTLVSLDAETTLEEWRAGNFKPR